MSESQSLTERIFRYCVDVLMYDANGKLNKEKKEQLYLKFKLCSKLYNFDIILRGTILTLSYMDTSYKITNNNNISIHCDLCCSIPRDVKCWHGTILINIIDRSTQKTLSMLSSIKF